MSRRALTLLLAAVLALGLTLSASVARVPYVALGPGPTYNTLGEVDGAPVLEINGRRTFPTDGHLDLTTVGVQPRLTLAQALRGWFERDLAVVPREVVFPPGRTDEQVNEENAAAMVASQSAAVGAAARQLGLSPRVVVAELGPDAAAQGKLEAGDVLLSVDGAPVGGAEQLRDLVSDRAPGQDVRIAFERDGRREEVVITTRAADADAARAVIGVSPEERYDLDVEITLEDVGGPSAGLMFALGILDKLDEPSLTGGKYIAGTGEIDVEGNVGPIGGITQKLIAARRKGAVAFLVPEANCQEAATRPPDGLTLVKVGTLEDALQGIEAVREGGSPVTCST